MQTFALTSASMKRKVAFIPKVVSSTPESSLLGLRCQKWDREVERPLSVNALEWIRIAMMH
jgi:hypothetical protein